MSSNQTSSQTTPWGVCAAIANFYGFTSPARLLSSLGIITPKKWYAFSQETVDLLLSNKTIALDMEISGLLKGVHYASVYDKNAHSQSLKVCKYCLKEGGLHHFNWQAVESTVCIKHRTPLTVSCSHMYADSSWSDSIRCKTCCTSMPRTAAMPKYEYYLESLGSNAEKIAFTSALKALAERMVRPFDFITTTIRWNKLAPSQVSKLLEDAFNLGGSANLFDLWQHLVVKHRSDVAVLGQTALNIEMTSLQSVIKQSCWPKRNFEDDNGNPETLLLNYHMSPIPKEAITEQLRFKYCQQPEEFSFLISGVMAAELLGVSPKTITELLKSGTLEGVHVCQQPDKQLFDIRELKQLLSGRNIDGSPQNNDYINVTDIPNVIYELYDFTPETLVNKALTGDVKSQVRVDSTVHYINSLQVSSESLKALLKKAWDDLQDCPKAKAAKILRTNIQIVNDLVKQGFLCVKPSNPELIDADSIRKFVDEYLLVNRKATFSRSRNIAQKIASCCNVKPILSAYMNPTKTDFVVFKKSDLSPCCMQHVPKRFAHFATSRVDLSKNVRLLFNNFSGDGNGHRYN